MNIQPIGTNQNRQQNFGMKTQWRALPRSLSQKEKTNVVKGGQRTFKKLLKMFTPGQKIELDAAFKALEDKPFILRLTTRGNRRRGYEVILDYFKLVRGKRKKQIGDFTVFDSFNLNGRTPIAPTKESPQQQYAQETGHEIITELTRLSRAPKVTAAKLAEMFGIKA